VLVRGQRSRGPGAPSYASHPERRKEWRRVNECPDFYRAAGACVCETCGKEYRKHPMDKNPGALAYDGRPFLRVLCSGERVKL
jgi:hypothetical protein